MTASRAPAAEFWSRLGGTLLFLIAWEAAGQLEALGKAWPALSTIVAYAAEGSHAQLLFGALGHTTGAAAAGFVLGSISGLSLACLAALYPTLKPGLNQLAALVNALPIIALGPVLIVTVGRTETPTAIAALVVFFGMFVAVTGGLAEARREQQEWMSSLGCRPWQALWLVQLPAAMPRIIDGLKLSVSAAVVGAILGEWFGSGAGIGLLLVSAMQNFQIELLWASALLGVSVALVAFAALSFAQRWAEARYR